ncbi:MAG: hypothetical protein JKY15_07990 [Deltaproteobacteria bacterium]|nr:hypothetical protein [Deltaproteobacteria bacterium]
MIGEISCPGKLVLAGEYAVLEGYPGLAMGVSRRVYLKPSNKLHRSKLWDAVSAGHDVEPRFEIDSSALYEGEHKLGLGSSAAAAVCMAGFIDSINPFRIALEGHQRFAGGLGSGIDVATCYQGGLVRFAKGGDIEPLWSNLNQETIMTVFTGKSSKTEVFLKKLQDYQKQNPDDYKQLIADIGALTPAWEEFYTGEATWALLSEVVQANREVLIKLSQAAKIQVMSSEQHAIWAICRQFGAFSKPSGAGGGDITLCFLPPEARTDLGFALRNSGFKPLKIGYFEPGLLESACAD